MAASESPADITEYRGSSLPTNDAGKFEAARRGRSESPREFAFAKRAKLTKIAHSGIVCLTKETFDPIPVLGW